MQERCTLWPAERKRQSEGVGQAWDWEGIQVVFRPPAAVTRTASAAESELLQKYSRIGVPAAGSQEGPGIGHKETRDARTRVRRACNYRRVTTKQTPQRRGPYII